MIIVQSFLYFSRTNLTLILFDVGFCIYNQRFCFPHCNSKSLFFTHLSKILHVEKGIIEGISQCFSTNNTNTQHFAENGSRPYIRCFKRGCPHILRSPSDGLHSSVLSLRPTVFSPQSPSDGLQSSVSVRRSSVVPQSPSDGLQSSVSVLRSSVSVRRSSVFSLLPTVFSLQSPSDGLQSPSDGLQSRSYGLQSRSYGLQSPSYGLQSPSYGLQSSVSVLRSTISVRRSSDRT